MNDDDLREMQLRMIDLNNRINNMSIFKKITTIITSKIYEIAIFLIIILAIMISHISMQDTIIKEINKSSIKNSNSIKKQIKEVL